MHEELPRGFHEVSPEDEQKMEQVIREAEGVLYADEVARRVMEGAEEAIRKEETLRAAKETLEEAGGEDIEKIEREFNAIFENPEYVKKLFSFFEKKYGWNENRSRAMVGVLRHALDRLYYQGKFSAPDEEALWETTRDTKTVLQKIIADDYGEELAVAITPFLEVYVKIADQLIKEEKKRKHN